MAPCALSCPRSSQPSAERACSFGTKSAVAGVQISWLPTVICAIWVESTLHTQRAVRRMNVLAVEKKHKNH